MDMTDLLTAATDTAPENATVRTAVRVPLQFPDGFTTVADIHSFDGLVDGKAHLLLGLGDWRGAVARMRAGGPAPPLRPHSHCLPGHVFGSHRRPIGPPPRVAPQRPGRPGGLPLPLRHGGAGH